MNLKENYLKVCDSFVNRIKKDKNILCIILGGSLHYGFVGRTSDINLIVIVRDGKSLERNYSLNEQDIVFNVDVFERSQFLKRLSSTEETPHFFAYLTNSSIVHCVDNALANYISESRQIGRESYELNILCEVTDALYYMHVIRKYLEEKGDTIYAQFNFVIISDILSKLEHYFNGIVIARDKTVACRRINPELMGYFHENALTQKWSLDKCHDALDKLDSYFMLHIDAISSPIIKLFSIKEKDVLTITEIARHFNLYAAFINVGCLYLAQKGVLGRTTVSVPITENGSVRGEEIAYHLV